MNKRKSKKYIITGGAGFIGSTLAKRLIKMGGKVYILDDLSTGFERNVPKGAIFHKVDIGDDKKLFSLKFPRNIECVYHLAAQSSGEASFEDPLKDIKANYISTYNILRLSKKVNCKRFIYTSSMSVYGKVHNNVSKVSEDYPCNPISYYGINKYASEGMISVYAKENNIQSTIFRLFNVYGPGQNMSNMKQGMVSIYFSYLMNNMPINVKGALNRVRDFIYIDDVIDILVKSENVKMSYGKVFNLGMGKKVSVRRLIETILKAYGKDKFDEWVYVKGSTPGDVQGLEADMKNIKSVFKWSPKYDLSTGISKMKKRIDETAKIWIKK